MKKIILFVVFASLVSFVNTGFAQQKKDTVKIGEGIDRTAKKVGNTTANTAKKVGNGTASTASKLAAKVTDKKYKDKVGPDGQTVFIDNHAKFYYVDSKGRKIYLSEDELKDKPSK